MIGNLKPLLMTLGKKVPVLGAILAGIGGLSSFFEDNPNETEEEKDKRIGKALGGTAGTIGGMMTGAKLGAVAGSFAGPVGTVIGSVVGGLAGTFFGDQAGQILGEKIGEFVAWIKGINFEEIWQTAANTVTESLQSAGKYLEAKWDEVKGSFAAAGQYIQEGWKSAKSWFDEQFEPVRKAWEPVAQKIEKIFEPFSKLIAKIEKWFGDKFGKVSETAGKAVDAVKEKNAEITGKVGEKVSAVKDAAIEKASGFAKSAKETTGNLWNSVKSRVSDAIDKAKKAPKWIEENTTIGKGVGAVKQGAESLSNKNWHLGATSERFESGGKGAGTVSNGTGDKGGVSYGTYQLASKTGTLDSFLNRSGYGRYFGGMTAGTAEFNAKWKELAKTDPNFGEAQHDFIKSTHYDPALLRLKKAGIDLSGKGRAVQDALWSTSTQYGAAGAGRLIQNALKGKDVNSLNDSEIVSAIQDYKIGNNERLFAGSSEAQRAGTLRRAHNEKAALLRLAQADTGADRNKAVIPAQADITKTTAVKVFASAPAVPALAQAPKVEPSAPVTVPLGENKDRPTIPTINIEGEVGQDVKDRNIAHIATGGFSGF